MRLSLPLVLCLGSGSLAVLSACSPTFNWREVRPENTGLSALFPCKPDKAQRSVALGGTLTELTLLGCETGGAMFALSVATLTDVSQVDDVLAGWQNATLANMKATGASQTLPVRLPGAGPQPLATRVGASGQRADGSALQSQSQYFSKGSQVFQAVIYAGRIEPETADTFFTNLKFDAEGRRP